jgi:4,4'-diaponeurosporenoate glycosyltransferase
MYNFIIIAAGWIAGLLLFWKLPELRQSGNSGQLPQITVIIPMRNEEKNIVLLLTDLMSQTFPPYEIICVDDESTDRSAAVAQARGAVVLTVGKKPSGWVGKSYACQLGAQKAACKTLVFLDADVRLAPDALAVLSSRHSALDCTLSVQPYHRVKSFYEYFSLFANIVLVASTGIGLPFHINTVAFFGPVLVINHETYDKLGGHTSVKGHILEDLMLGRHYTINHMPSRLFIGGKLISFSMYSGGFKQLWQGWTKNIFTGASNIPIPMLLLIVMLMAAYATSVFVVAQACIHGGIFWYTASVFSYAISAMQILVISRKLGSFNLLAAVFYPLFLVGFIVMFVVSAFKKLVLKRTRWKGRDIPL